MLLFPDKKKLKQGSKGGRLKGGKPKGGDKQPAPDPDKQSEPEPRRSGCKHTPRGTVILFSCINSNIVHLS